MEDAQPIAVINYSLYHEMFPKYSAIYVASTYGTIEILRSPIEPGPQIGNESKIGAHSNKISVTVRLP